MNVANDWPSDAIIIVIIGTLLIVECCNTIKQYILFWSKASKEDWIPYWREKHVLRFTYFKAPPVNDCPSQTVTSEGEKLDPVTQAIYDNMMGKLPKKRKLEIPCAACDMVFNSEVKFAFYSTWKKN